MKTIKYITITLFAIVAVLWGLLLNGCENPAPMRTIIHDTIVVYKTTIIHHKHPDNSMNSWYYPGVGEIRSLIIKK